jgi:glycosyltransferase involved in cell wall biosynthesis
MLLTFSIAVAIIGILSLGQFAFACAYSRLFTRNTNRYAYPREGKAVYSPKAAVIVALRGADPGLEANLRSVLDLDYPDYIFCIIVDSVHDSAWKIAARVRDVAPSRVRLLTLQNKLSTCSLKCSALAEAVEMLKPEVEVVAILDGDVSPHKSWLQELVQPLQDPAIGAATGNRWYTPAHCSWGALVRYFWNTGAVVQVWLNGITWGGSMAMKREVIQRTGMIEAWRRSLVDDGAVVRILKKSKLRVAFVPSVMIPNCEDIRLVNFIPWAERQMIAAKSAASGWTVIFLHALIIAVCVLLPPAIAALGVICHDRDMMMLGLIGASMYWGLAVFSSIAVERGVMRSLVASRGSKKWISLRGLLTYLPALVLSHFVYWRVLWGACRRTRVGWRGIEYRLLGVHDVEMVAYRPFRPIIPTEQFDNAQPSLESVI